MKLIGVVLALVLLTMVGIQAAPHVGFWWRGQPVLPMLELADAPGGALRVEVAVAPMALQHGLSRRRSLPANTGMLFLFPEVEPRAFWMKQMRFPLDIVFLRNKVVVAVFERVPPPEPGRQPVTVQVPEPGADAVLELPAGEASSRQITAGTVFSSLPSFR